mmetsp:Transcript_107043/g.301607  ORF Transcript_107043/g.301607 Transcript_107043/m.301607 type:complete len:385 (+) Transcript_107043:507-1661(+)
MIEGPGVVVAQVRNVLYLEPCLLEVSDHPTHRARCIRSWENVLVHEHAPNQVLIVIVPCGVAAGQAGNLEVEGALIIEHAVHPAQELVVVLDAHVLSHLDRRDHVEFLLGDRHVEEVRQHDIDLVVAELLGHPPGVGLLIRGHGHACDVRALAGQVVRKAAPAAADLERLVAGLDTEGMCNEVEFVELCAPHRVVGACVDRARVHHGLAQSRLKPVVALVVRLREVVGVLDGVVEDGATQPGPQVPVQLDLAKHGRVLLALQDLHHVALAVVDVVLQRLAHSGLTHVVALLGSQLVRLIEHQAAKTGENHQGRQHHPQAIGLANDAHQNRSARDHVRHSLRNKHHQLKNRKHHLHHHFGNRSAALIRFRVGVLSLGPSSGAKAA